MKVFITGATGFVGGHLLEKLHFKGVEVLGLARTQKKWDAFNLPGTPILGNLSQLEEWVEKLPDDLTHFVHTAGIVHSFQPEDFDKTNAKATIDLYNLLVKKYPKLHFIFISSLAAAGPSLNGDRVKVTDTPKPVSAYGRSKERAENYLIENLADNHTLTIIRPPMVIGPRDPAVLDVFKMVKGKVVLNTGLNGPKKRYSIICVYDLVDIIIASLKVDETRKVRTYFPSYPMDYSFGEIIEAIEESLKIKSFKLPIPFPVIRGLAETLNLLYKVKKHDLRLTPDKINELAPDAWICSGEEVESELNYTYAWDLEKTVTTTTKDYLERGWL